VDLLQWSLDKATKWLGEEEAHALQVIKFRWAGRPSVPECVSFLAEHKFDFVENGTHFWKTPTLDAAAKVCESWAKKASDNGLRVPVSVLARWMEFVIFNNCSERYEDVFIKTSSSETTLPKPYYSPALFFPPQLIDPKAQETVELALSLQTHAEEYLTTMFPF
jgi:hypothetical protein